MKTILLTLLIAIPAYADCRTVCTEDSPKPSSYSQGYNSHSTALDNLANSLTERNHAETENLHEDTFLKQIEGQKLDSNPTEPFPGAQWAVDNYVNQKLRKAGR